MNEAERCDRISLMHAGRVLVTDSPAAIVAAARRRATLEEAFVGCLEEASSEPARHVPPPRTRLPSRPTAPARPAETAPAASSSRRLLAYSRREALELVARSDARHARPARQRHPDVRHRLRHQHGRREPDASRCSTATTRSTSRDYALNIAARATSPSSPPLAEYADLDRRMRSGELSLAIEIPPDFARDIARGRAVEIGAWIDGAMPMRAETARGYVQGMHAQWLARDAATRRPAAVRIEARFRYNPDVQSLVAMVPAVIPMLLLLIPAMLTALSVVREKELGSIVNFYVTPVTPARVPARQAAALRRARHGELPAADASRGHRFRRAVQGQLRRPWRPAALLYVFARPASACCSRPSCAARSRRSSAPRSAP